MVATASEAHTRSNLVRGVWKFFKDISQVSNELKVRSGVTNADEKKCNEKMHAQWTLGQFQIYSKIRCFSP